jgi:uncharacterized protein (TIGR00369 family)
MADEQPPDRIKTVTWEDPRTAAREARRMSGTEFYDAMRRGRLPEPPFGRLLGIDLFDAGDGLFKLSLQPQEVHYNPMGCVHGGILATLLDSVMSAAVHTALPAGRGYLTTEITVRFLRPVFQSTGEIMAEGRLVSCRASARRRKAPSSTRDTSFMRRQPPRAPFSGLAGTRTALAARPSSSMRTASASPAG